MRNFIFFLTSVMVLMTASAFGHSGGHDHSPGPAIPITVSQAILKASDIVATIVEDGRLDTSWLKIIATKAEKKKYQQGEEWVVSFENLKEADPGKKALYIFLALDGRYIAANFTGK